MLSNHAAWLKIAQDDLRAAKCLIGGELYSSSVSHCQQAAEKALKGFLVFKGQPIVKTHDLLLLLELCVSIDMNFKKLFEDANYINPLAVRFRYPTEFDIPERDDAEQAVKHAQKILAFVLKKVSAPDTGQEKLF